MYNEKTLAKFNKDKTMKFFPGISIVHNFCSDLLNQQIVEVKHELEKTSFADKMIFLPESSYHMTVADLSIYIDIVGQEGLSDNNIYELDKLYIDKLKNCPALETVTMVVDYFSHPAIYLKPKTEKDKRIIDDYRKMIHNQLNIELDPNYLFHISICYMLEELDEKEYLEMSKLNNRLKANLAANIGDIVIDKSEVVLFNDMSEFRHYSQGRKNLGVTSRF